MPNHCKSEDLPFCLSKHEFHGDVNGASASRFSSAVFFALSFSVLGKDIFYCRKTKRRRV